MTSAPQDLLGLRADIRTITGLGAADVGIVGDGAHQRTGGFHEGIDVLKSIGRYHAPVSANVGSSTEDYSARQARDRNGLSNSSSAVDIGSAWKQGRVTWLRFNGLLYREMVEHPERLPALRAINVSLDGKAKRRYDQLHRGDGLIASTDTVDTHTHLEFWRDTEGRRTATLARIVELARAAVGGTTPAASTGDDMSADTEAIIKAWSVGLPVASTGSTVEPVKWRISDEAWQKRIETTIAAIAADAKASRIAIEALVATFNKTGGSVDSAKVIARMDELAAAEVAREQALLARIADLEAKLAATRAAAEANLSPAELAKLGL